MGMYTALSLGIELKRDVPQHVIDVLRYMVGDFDDGYTLTSHPDHPFFDCARWHFLLRCDSYYFDWQTHWSFEKDHINEQYYLSGVSNLKNYNNEIVQFMSWIRPYIDDSAQGFIGWTQYEEQLAPDLIIRGTDGEIRFVQTEQLIEKELLI